MIGLLIGTHFAIKGIFQLLGVLIVYTPISIGCNSRNKFPICGFVYFLVNTLVALTGLIAFILVAKRYRNRERDEPDNISVALLKSTMLIIKMNNTMNIITMMTLK